MPFKSDEDRRTYQRTRYTEPLVNEKKRAQTRDYYRRNRTKVLEYQRPYQAKRLRRLKLQVLGHYSPSLTCAHCGFSDVRALSIDHIQGGGGKHTKEIHASGGSFYRWLSRNNYPSGYQVLCMNCQWIKRVEKGETRKSLAPTESSNHEVS